jgi:hypothetical protein
MRQPIPRIVAVTELAAQLIGTIIVGAVIGLGIIIVLT